MRMILSILIRKCSLIFQNVLGSGGIEQPGKRTHGHGQHYGDCWWEGGKMELNNNEKNYNENKIYIQYRWVLLTTIGPIVMHPECKPHLSLSLLL